GDRNPHPGRRIAPQGGQRVAGRWRSEARSRQRWHDPGALRPAARPGGMGRNGLRKARAGDYDEGPLSLRAVAYGIDLRPSTTPARDRSPRALAVLAGGLAMLAAAGCSHSAATSSKLPQGVVTISTSAGPVLLHVQVART